MKDYSPAAIEALESGSFAERKLIWVEMPDAPVGFWNDAYDAEIEERVYLATYGGIQFGPRATAADLGMQTQSLFISGLDAQVASQVLAAPYRKRQIFLSDVTINPETQQVIDLTQWFAGRIDQIVRRERLNGAAILEVRCTGIAHELNRTMLRTRSDPDHRQLASDDPFYAEVVSSNNTPLQWGRVKTAKPKSWIDKIF